MGNRVMWREFGIQVNELLNINWVPHPCIPDGKLWIMPDPVHVFKAIVEMLKSNGIIFLDANTVQSHDLPTNEVRFQDIIDLSNLQKDIRWKLAPKLNEDLFKNSHFSKMSVHHATAIFNHQTAAALNVLSAVQMNPGMKTTSWFIALVTDWFKFMTARTSKLALDLFNTAAYNSHRSIETDNGCVSKHEVW